MYIVRKCVRNIRSTYTFRFTFLVLFAKICVYTEIQPIIVGCELIVIVLN